MAIPILGGLVKSVLGVATDVFDDLHLSGEEKQAFKLKLEEVAAQREAQWESTFRTEIEAKERILVAELKQGDNFTKRMRPSIGYSGLLFAFMEVIVRGYFAFKGRELPADFSSIVPTQFWVAWAGITGVYAIGRSAEKRATIQQEEAGRLTKLITGG